MLFMIAAVKENNAIIGVRLIETSTRKVMNLRADKVVYMIESGDVSIENLIVESGTLACKGGSIEEYAIVNKKLRLLSLAPLVILSRTQNNQYVCSDYNGRVDYLSEDELLEYSSIHGLANGVINGNSIKPIEQEYRIDSSKDIQEEIIKYRAKCKMLGKVPLEIEPDGDSAIVVKASSSMDSCIIPNFVRKIGKDAFIGCENIENINIPEGVIEIEERAFSNCLGLRSVILPNSLKAIGANAFEGCEKLKVLEFGNEIEIIGDEAFTRCGSLQDVVISSKLKSLGQRAFKGCSKLSSIEIPGSIQWLRRSTFNRCTKLYKVVIGQGIKSIGEKAFKGCVSLEVIDMPNTLEKIDQSAFVSCHSIENIVIPDSVKIISNNVFQYCSGIKEIYLPKELSVIGLDAFRDCSCLNLVKAPLSIASNISVKCKVETY